MPTPPEKRLLINHRRLLGILVVLFAGGAAALAGEVFKVPPGSASAAIQKIVNGASAAPGQPATVLFPRGEYVIDDTVHVRKGIHLKGEGPESRLVVRKVLPVERVDVRPAIRIEGVKTDPSVVIEDLSLASALPNDETTNGKEGGTTGIAVFDCTGVTIRRCSLNRMASGIGCQASRKCVFEDLDLHFIQHCITFSCGKEGVHEGGHVLKNNRFTPFLHGAVAVWKQDECLLAGNYAEGKDKFSGGAYFFTSCNRTVVRGNVAGQSENGIQFVTHGGRSCDGNRVEDNVVYGCHPFSPTGSGLSLQADYTGSFKGNVFKRNVVFDCDIGITLSQPNPRHRGPAVGTVIEGNHIHNVGSGILLSGARDATVKNNRIADAVACGIILRRAQSGIPSTGNTLTGNFIYECRRSGVLVQPGHNDRNRITDNMLKNNRDGIDIQSAGGTVVTGNLIHETMNYTRSAKGLRIKGRGNDVRDNKFDRH